VVTSIDISAEALREAVAEVKSDFVAVDLNWLERILNSLGEVERYSSKMMNVYICKKAASLDCAIGYGI
jgi:hypothetical protein